MIVLRFYDPRLRIFPPVAGFVVKRGLYDGDVQENVAKVLPYRNSVMEKIHVDVIEPVFTNLDGKHGWGRSEFVTFEYDCRCLWRQSGCLHPTEPLCYCIIPMIYSIVV